jgi:hypothetical protein
VKPQILIVGAGPAGLVATLGEATNPRVRRIAAEGGLSALRRTGSLPRFASVERGEVRYVPRPAALRALRLGVLRLTV